VKICKCFVQNCAVTGSGVYTYSIDLAWAWAVFERRSGVPTPDDWLRQLVLEYGCELEEPPPEMSRHGWLVRGIGLNPEYTIRLTKARLSRLGVRMLSR
jgi:hypothetical protein